MTIHTRRILYLCFIAAFIITTPLVILYASGYNFKNGFSIQKTGILIIKSDPPGAKIYLNGKAQKEFSLNFFSDINNFVFTPAKIKNLSAGNYDVKIEADNYWPWQKKLQILPGETTYAENVILFKKSLPVNIINTPGANAGFSPDKKFDLIIDRNNFIKIDLGNGNKEEYKFAATTTRPIGQFSWSVNSTKVLVGKYLFFTDNWNKPLDLEPVISKNINSLKWSSENDNLLFYKNGQNIFSYNLTTKATLPVLPDCSCSDFLVKNGSIYLIIANNGQVSLKINDVNGHLLNKIDLPNSSYKFINPQTKLLNLYDYSHKILYLIDPSLPFGNLRDIINNVVITNWIYDDQLFYSDGYEIRVFNLTNSSKTLLTRVSNKINNIIWHPSKNYILFNTDQELNILELDNRDKYNITKILSINSLKNSVLSDDGKNLYFSGKIGKQQGLFELLIQQ
jgi:hypothetical protein